MPYTIKNLEVSAGVSSIANFLAPSVSTPSIKIGTDDSAGNYGVVGFIQSENSITLGPSSKDNILKLSSTSGIFDGDISSTHLSIASASGGNIDLFDVNHAIKGRTGVDATVNTVDLHSFGKIRFYTDGVLASQTEKLTILSNGNVGIGTSSPGSSLHVAGLIADAIGDGVHIGLESNYGIIQLNGSVGSFIDFSESGTDYRGRIQYINSSNVMDISTNGTLKLTISDSVTTLQTDFLVNGQLKLQATAGDPSPVIASRLVPAGQGASNERSELIVFHGNDGVGGAGEDLITLRAPALRFQTYTDLTVSDMDNDLGSNTRMYINPAGNVGIGTTAPNAQLQLSNVTGNRKIVLYDDNNNDHQYSGFGLNASELRYQVAVNTVDHVFYTGTGISSSAELMRIEGTGNVGIGTNIPGSSLHVAGAIVDGPLGNGVHMGISGGTYSAIQLNNSIGSFIDFSESGVDFKGRILYTNSSDVMDIYANGFVRLSIGTTVTMPSGLSVTGSIIQSGSATSTFTNTTSSAGYVYPMHVLAPNSGQPAMIIGQTDISGNYGILSYIKADDTIRFGPSANTSALIVGASTTRLNTNVGIGVDPSHKLDVVDGVIAARCSVDGVPSASVLITNTSSGSSAYSLFAMGTDSPNNFVILKNSTTRTNDGGVNTTTLRNDGGDIKLQSSGSNGLTIASSSGISTFNAPNQILTLSATGENQDVTLNFGTPNGTTFSKAAVICEGITNWSRSKMHFCLDNTLDNTATSIAKIENARMTIEPGGNIGVGITSPGAKLHLENSAGLVDLQLSAPTGGFIDFSEPGVDFNGRIIYYNSTDNFDIMTAGVVRLTLGTTLTTMQTDLYVNGNVGIGTNSPGSSLHVAGSMTAGPIGNGVHMGTDGSNYSGIQLNNSGGSFVDFSESGVDHKGRIIYTNSTNVMDIITNGTLKLTISDTVATLQTDLLVNGQIKLQAPTGDLSPVIASRVVPAGQGASNQRSEFILFHGNDGANGSGEDLITLRAPALRFQTYTDASVADIDNDLGSNTRMYINPSGNVGIGTTSPGSSLHVAGTIANEPLGNGIHMGISGGTYSSIQLNNSVGSFIDFSESGVDFKGRLIYTNSTNVLDIHTNGLNRMSIGTSIIQNVKSIINGDFNTGEFLRIEKGGAISWGSTAAYDATRYIRCLGNAEFTKDFNVGPGGVGIGYAPPLYSKAGTDGLYVNGNIGVGTTDPVVPLHVNGLISRTTPLALMPITGLIALTSAGTTPMTWGAALIGSLASVELSYNANGTFTYTGSAPATFHINFGLWITSVSTPGVAGAWFYIDTVINARFHQYVVSQSTLNGTYTFAMTTNQTFSIGVQLASAFTANVNPSGYDYTWLRVMRI